MNHGIGGKLGKVAGRSDGGKAIVQTIDPDFILGIARVSEFGARKYHMRNFLMAPGMPWSQVYASLMRHLMLWWGGEELDVGPNGEYGPYPDDPEIDMKWSGLPHIHMVAWNVMVLCTYQRPVYSPGDDRPSVLEYVGGIWKDWEAEFNEIRELDQNPEPDHPEKSADTPESIVKEMKARLQALGYEGSLTLNQSNNLISIKL